MADLSRALATPKSSLAALLRGLVVANFVVASEGTYRLGAGAFGLGSALLEARRRIHTSDLIRDGMRRLAERSGETVLFAVRDAEETTITYVDVIESRNAVRFHVSAGDRRPLYCTSGGRILLAHASPDEIKRYFKQLKPQRLTAKTELDKRKLSQAIEAAREQGFARTVDQASDGVTGTAAAIRDESGALRGALIVAAPSARIDKRGAELARLVREEAATISRSLGYRLRALSAAR